MWGQPPSAVRGAQLRTGFDSRGCPGCQSEDFREIGKTKFQFGNFLAGEKGELRSPGKPMAAVPT
jgi:hypothetical protein